jgi:hypothetical protein
MNWIQKNFKKIIYVSFLIPIILVALVSISHVTKWYGISNPVSWAVYLSVGIEIAALSALAAISAKMGKKVYFPFGIVTLIQFIGNIFFAYQFIDINSVVFKDWVDLVSPLVSYLGVDPSDPIGHKRFLAFFSGGMLPLISLSFLHMLVKFEENDKIETINTPPVIPIVNIDELSTIAGKAEAAELKDRYVPTEEDLLKIETLLGLTQTVTESAPEVVEEVIEVPEEVVVEPTPEVIEDVVIETELKEESNNSDFGPKINRLSYTK